MRILIAGYKLPQGAQTGAFQIANANDVPLQALPNHGPTTRFKFLMGQTTSKRDRIAAASEMSSLFLFYPPGTKVGYYSGAKEGQPHDLILAIRSRLSSQ